MASQTQGRRSAMCEGDTTSRQRGYFTLCKTVGIYLETFSRPPGQSAVMVAVALDVFTALVDVEFHKCALSRLTRKFRARHASHFRQYSIAAQFF